MRKLSRVICAGLLAALSVPLAAESFDLDALESFVPALMRKRGTAGLQICIESGPDRLCRSYGVRDMEKSPVDDNTLFLAAGLLRPFSALAVDRSRDVLLDGKPMRMRDLLSESAGLGPVEHLGLPGKPLPHVEPSIRLRLRPGVPSASAANWFLISRDSGPERFLGEAASKINALGGNSLRAQVTDGEIVIGGGQKSAGLTVAGYRLFLTPVPPSAVPAMDGLWVNARNYQALFSRLPASSFELLARNPDAGPGLSGTGAGLEILEDPCAAGTFARVQGERGTFSALAASRPGWSIVILANSGTAHSLRELFHFVRKWVLPARCEFYTRTLEPDEQIEGDYRPLETASPGFATSLFQDLRIEASDGGPVITGMFDAASSADLVRMEDGSYMVRGGAAMDGWKLAFQKENGKVTGFVSERSSYKRIPALFSMRGYPVLLTIILFAALGSLVVFLIRKRRST